MQKKPSEVSVSCVPTRTALLQIALLKPGDMFVSIIITAKRGHVTNIELGIKRHMFLGFRPQT